MEPAVKLWPLKNYFAIGAVIMTWTTNNSSPTASNIVTKTAKKTILKLSMKTVLPL